MRYRVSNRVFWAGVVLAGCAIVSGRADSQKAPDIITAREIRIVDGAGNPRIRLGLSELGEAEIFMLRAKSMYPTLALVDGVSKSHEDRTEMRIQPSPERMFLQKSGLGIVTISSSSKTGSTLRMTDEHVHSKVSLSTNEITFSDPKPRARWLGVD